METHKQEIQEEPEGKAPEGQDSANGGKVISYVIMDLSRRLGRLFILLLLHVLVIKLQAYRHNAVHLVQIKEIQRHHFLQFLLLMF